MMKRFFLLTTVFSMFSIITPSAQADAINDWQNAVIKKVLAKQSYPRLAVARQIEGKARVTLTVAADGTISNFEIVEPTGESVLDRAIPKLIGRLSPLPPLPDGRSEMNFTLPLSWSLD